MKKRNIAVLVAALVAGVGFAYFILGRAAKEGPIVEDFEGIVDTLRVVPDSTAADTMTVIEEPMPSPADSTLPDSLD